MSLGGPTTPMPLSMLASVGVQTPGGFKVADAAIATATGAAADERDCGEMLRLAGCGDDDAKRADDSCLASISQYLAEVILCGALAVPCRIELPGCTPGNTGWQNCAERVCCELL